MDIISTSMGLLLFLGLCGDGWRLRHKKGRTANYNGSGIGVAGIYSPQRDRRSLTPYCQLSDRPMGFKIK
jgi:hypothetical protein